MRYYIGFGSNVGHREEWLKRALARLQAEVGKVVAISKPFFNGAVVLPGDDPSKHAEYLNVVIGLDCELTPSELMRVLLSIEQDLGRNREKEDALKATLSGFVELVNERSAKLGGDVERIRAFFSDASGPSSAATFSIEKEDALRRSLRQLEDLIIVARTALIVRKIILDPDPPAGAHPHDNELLGRLLRELRTASHNSMVSTIGSGGGVGGGDISLGKLFVAHREEFDRLLGPE